MTRNTLCGFPYNIMYALLIDSLHYICDTFHRLLDFIATIRITTFRKIPIKSDDPPYALNLLQLEIVMKNALIWDIKTQFVPYRKHVTSLLPSVSG
jgi:hypothetical protein